MANTYLTISMITYEMLMVLHNNIVVAKKVNRNYEKQFARTGAKIGQQVQIRKPPLYTVTDGAAFVGQDYTETQVPLVITQHKQIGVEFANDDLTLSMDDFSGRFVKPAMVPLANQVDVDVVANFTMAWNTTGTPGTPAATSTPFLDAKTLLINNAAPGDDWPMVVTPFVDARLSDGLAGRFNPQKDISGLFLKGSMGPFGGWEFFDSQNMPVFTTGAWSANVVGTGITVNGANQIGSSITLQGATASITNMAVTGDVIQFAGSYQLNPVTYQSTGQLQNFVITANASSSGGGALVVSISPSIILTPNKGATVSNSPANGAYVYVFGQQAASYPNAVVTPQCMGWQNEAITLACVDLYMPETGEGVKAERAADDDLGMSILFMKAFDPKAYSKLSRMDILYGTTFPRPEHVVRVCS